MQLSRSDEDSTWTHSCTHIPSYLKRKHLRDSRLLPRGSQPWVGRPSGPVGTWSIEIDINYVSFALFTSPSESCTHQRRSKSMSGFVCLHVADLTAKKFKQWPLTSTGWNQCNILLNLPARREAHTSQRWLQQDRSIDMTSAFSRPSKVFSSLIWHHHIHHLAPSTLPSFALWVSSKLHSHNEPP
jgi:hypothetical protein